MNRNQMVRDLSMIVIMILTLNDCYLKLIHLKNDSILFINSYACKAGKVSLQHFHFPVRCFIALP